MITFVETELNEVYYKLLLKRTDLSLVKLTNLQNILKAVFISTFCLSVLTNCSTQTQQKKIAPVVKTDPEELTGQLSQPTAKKTLKQAKLLPNEKAIPLLVSASEFFIIEQNYKKALWLANQTEPLTQVPLFNYRLAVVKAQALFLLNNAPLAYEQLSKANRLAESANIEHNASYYKVLTEVQNQRQLNVQAIDAQLRAFNLNEQASLDGVFIIWQKLSQLSQWQVEQLMALKPPYYQGWNQLLSYANTFGDNNDKFNHYLSQWQRNYPAHPGNGIIESLRINQSLAASIDHIAIILPLSGSQKAAGNAAQQGVLSAYEDDTSKILHFFDANKVDWLTLSTELASEEIDFVIGPLLKTNVDAYLNQPELTLPTLFLNVPSKIQFKPSQAALSMRPEDEAIQAASTLSQRNFKFPIIFSHKDKVSERIASAFAQQWALMSDSTPEIISFEQGKQMQVILKESLDVSVSQSRISELNRRLKQTFKSELRNRRDTDMIYIVGSPQQTRLLKPYIDVNTSPFAKVIPVYASSRSHSVKNDSSDHTDLTGLTFTEIPWMLESKLQNKKLAQQSKLLWPERNDSLQRIFAMGYDSLFLSDKLAVMQEKPFVRHFGQTGVLQLNADGILTRSLIWGRYRQNKVQQVAIN